MKKEYVITLVVAVVVGALGFFGGTKYQQGKVAGASTQGSQAQARGRFGNGMGNRGGVTGEVISADDKSITVKLPDGSTKIILFSDSTAINKAAEASKSDLKTGERVAVFGNTNSDGSVTAQNIQINPIFRTGQQSPNPTPTGVPTQNQ